MDDLIAFLRGRLDEDEQAARYAAAVLSAALVPGAVIDEHEGEWDGGREWEAKPWLVGARVETDLGKWGVQEIARTRAAYHIARHDPARVQREVEAKRRLIARGDTLFCDCDHAEAPPMDPDTNWTVPLAHHFDCTAYRIAMELATAYRDHPDYRPEWAPEP